MPAPKYTMGTMNLIPLIPSRLIRDLDKSLWSYTSHKCNLCGCIGAIAFEHKLYPDFTVRTGRSFTQKLLNATDGICLNCGHFHRLSKLEEAELDEFLRYYIDKRQTSEGKNDPLYSTSLLDKARSDLVAQAVRRFHAARRPPRIYIARPTSFLTIRAVLEELSDSEIFFSENLGDVRESIRALFPQTIDLDFEVHGRLRLPQGMDLIVIVHCLQHVLDINEALERIVELAKSSCSVLLVEEVQRKLHNPFHVNHFSECFLKNILTSRGLDVESITTPMLEVDEVQLGLQDSKFLSALLVYDKNHSRDWLCS